MLASVKLGDQKVSCSTNNSPSTATWKTNTWVVQALRTEVKQCIEKVEKLSEEFQEIKSNVQETLEEVDKTRCAVTELTVKLLSSNWYCLIKHWIFVFFKNCVIVIIHNNYTTWQHEVNTSLWEDLHISTKQVKNDIKMAMLFFSFIRNFMCFGHRVITNNFAGVPLYLSCVF